MSLANKSQHKKKGNSMTELALENITRTRCLTCNDKLTDWEDTFCIMCEPDGYDLDN
jgi:hypothetical protein